MMALKIVMENNITTKLINQNEMTKKQIDKAKIKLLKQERHIAFKRVSDYLMIVGGLSYLIDIIEDLNDTIMIPDINKQLKETIDILIQQDDLFLAGAEIDVIEQQNNIKRAFRQFQTDIFLNDLK